jgi:hypothetical protein
MEDSEMAIDILTFSVCCSWVLFAKQKKRVLANKKIILVDPIKGKISFFPWNKPPSYWGFHIYGNPLIIYS